VTTETGFISASRLQQTATAPVHARKRLTLFELYLHDLP
jgi:hypothetical protein